MAHFPNFFPVLFCFCLPLFVAFFFVPLNFSPGFGSPQHNNNFTRTPNTPLAVWEMIKKWANSFGNRNECNTHTHTHRHTQTHRLSYLQRAVWPFWMTMVLNGCSIATDWLSQWRRTPERSPGRPQLPLGRSPPSSRSSSSSQQTQWWTPTHDKKKDQMPVETKQKTKIAVLESQLCRTRRLFMYLKTTSAPTGQMPETSAAAEDGLTLGATRPRTHTHPRHGTARHGTQHTPAAHFVWDANG